MNFYGDVHYTTVPVDYMIQMLRVLTDSVSFSTASAICQSMPPILIESIFVPSSIDFCEVQNEKSGVW